MDLFNFIIILHKIQGILLQCRNYTPIMYNMQEGKSDLLFYI